MRGEGMGTCLHGIARLDGRSSLKHPSHPCRIYGLAPREPKLRINRIWPIKLGTRCSLCKAGSDQALPAGPPPPRHWGMLPPRGWKRLAVASSDRRPPRKWVMYAPSPRLEAPGCCQLGSPPPRQWDIYGHKLKGHDSDVLSTYHMVVLSP